MVSFFRKALRAWFDFPLMLKGMIVISIPLFCILYSVFVLYIFQEQRGELTDWIAQAFQAGTRIQLLRNSLVDAESGTRGYLLTGDAKYLEPLQKAEKELPQRLTRLREALKNSPSQLNRVEQVDRLSHERLARLRTALLDSGPSTLPARLAEGRSLSDALEREFTDMRSEESRVWEQRIRAESTLRKRLTWAMYGGAILSLMAGSLAMALFLTGIVRRSQLLRENADRLARGERLTELTPSTDEIGKLGEALARSSQLISEQATELRQLNRALNLQVKEGAVQLEQETAERKRSEEQLRHAQKMEAIGRLAGGVAHDFNNVLTVIFGFGYALSEKLPSDSDARQDLQEMIRAADHAVSLTRQLLAFSRRQVIQPKIVDLNTVVTRTEKLLRHVIGEDIQLHTSKAPDLAKIRVDEGQMEQVIMNLAVNARDAMPTGGRLVIRTEEVEIDENYAGAHLYAAPGRYVMLAVTDSGIGMSEDVKARIFEPFFTTKERGKGTGLGLSTVYGIVEQSGGSIWVYSELNAGTTFKIYLPVSDETVERVAAAASEPEHGDSAVILLVEDDPTVRRMTSQVLTRAGHKVLEADGVETARRICSEYSGSPDLLLTDVIMPHTSGRDLAQELQALYPALKVLYMSGYTDDMITRKGILEGAVAFIEKPFTPKSLSSKIREVLSGGARNEDASSDDRSETATVD